MTWDGGGSPRLAGLRAPGRLFSELWGKGLQEDGCLGCPFLHLPPIPSPGAPTRGCQTGVTPRSEKVTLSPLRKLSGGEKSPETHGRRSELLLALKIALTAPHSSPGLRVPLGKMWSPNYMISESLLFLSVLFED